MKKIPLNYFLAIVFAAVPISLAACTGAYVTGEGTEYNIALSEYMNKEVLLNAVRTSKRRPISFAGVGGLQGTINRGAAAAASFPFQDGAKNWTFAPTVKADYNNIVAYSNLNTDEFYAKLIQPIKPAVFYQYEQAHWPRDVLYALMVANIKVPASSSRQMWALKERICSNGMEWRKCDALDQDIAELERADCKREVKSIREPRAPEVFYFNEPRDHCSFVKFRAFVLLLSLLGYHPESEPEKAYVPVSRKEVKGGKTPYKIETTSNYVKSSKIVLKSKTRFPFSRKGDEPTLTLRDADPIDSTQKNDEALSATIELRSPAGIIYYLGGLVAAQNYISPRFDPKIREGSDFNLVELFDVVRGRVRGAVIVITDEEGEAFSVPRPQYGQSNESQSLTVVTLITQIVALQTRTKDVPVPQVITLTSTN